MARHKGRFKVKQLVLPVAAVLIIVLFVVAADLYGFNNPPNGKTFAPASEYFRINAWVDSTYGFNESQQKDGTYYVIYAMGFNITAVEGNANGVVVYWANAASDEVNIRQGQSALVEVLSKYGLPVGPVNGSTFQTKIRVACDEAEGYVTLTVS